jgi:ADP-ribose pyrophosphatase YjhB (NUDIX family)
VKPLKRSVSLVIEGPRGVLLVRRPVGDESLPGLWGLPAVSLTEGESEEEGILRAGLQKLGVEVRALRPLGEEEDERASYRIAMRDWEAEIVSGEPAVPQPGPGTQYEEWRWGDPSELTTAARGGSLCARVLLRERGLGSEW